MKKYLILLFVLISAFVLAQPGGGGDPGGGQPVPLPGIGILVAAGAFLGIRSLMKSKKSVLDQEK